MRAVRNVDDELDKRKRRINTIERIEVKRKR